MDEKITCVVAWGSAGACGFYFPECGFWEIAENWHGWQRKKMGFEADPGIKIVCIDTHFETEIADLGEVLLEETTLLDIN